MQYKEGSLGRVFIAKMENEDNLLEEITRMIEKENIKTAIFYLIGALEKASLVSGPKECVFPPEQLWQKFDDGREIIGIGTVFRNEENSPMIHLHGAFGKGEKALMGCVRSNTKVYLVAELILLEITNTNAFKELDKLSGFELLNLD